MRIWALFSLITIVAILTENAAFSAKNTPKKETFACLIDRISGDVMGLTPEERQVFAEVKGDIREMTAKSADESQRLTSAVFKQLEEAPIPKPSKTSKRKGTFSVDEIQRLYDEVANNSLIKKTQCGGAKNGGYAQSEDGFCFARAWAVQKEALKEIGTNPNIKKLWVVGNLRADKTDFSYHVATAVRADDGSWHVIDPDFAQPMKIRDWYAEVAKWNRDKKLRLFATPGKYFNAIFPYQLSTSNLTSGKPFYDFFVDYLDEFYLATTGKRGPWNRLREEKARRKVILQALQWLGLGAVGGGAYYIHETHPELRVVRPNPTSSPQ
jgi:hypothetical protein